MSYLVAASAVAAAGEPSSCCWHLNISSLGRCPKPKADMCWGFFSPGCSSCHDSLPLGALISLSFLFGGPVLRFWGYRQICVTWSNTIMSEWAHWSEEGRTNTARKQAAKWTETKQKGIMRPLQSWPCHILAMYLPQREGLKEIACLSRLSRCLLWQMGCLPSSEIQSAAGFRAAPKPW